jgi:hypothetical protein
MRLALCTTVSIRIGADCVALPCQVTKKMKRAKTLEFTAISAIIFIHCYALAFIQSLNIYTNYSIVILYIPPCNSFFDDNCSVNSMKLLDLRPVFTFVLLK